MFEKILKILSEVRPDIDFGAATGLMTTGLLDSFDMVAIIGELADRFDVQIPVEEINADNFDSVESMIALIERVRAVD